MPIEYNIKGTVSFEEYLECHEVLAAKRHLWLRGIIITYGAGVMVYGTTFSASKPDATCILIGAILLLYGFVISPIRFRFGVRRNWERYPKIKKDFDITISEDGVAALDDKGSPSHSDWDSFLRFRESPSLFLLYLSPHLPLCIPKRLIAEGDQAGVRDLLSSAIGDKSNGEKGAAPEP